MIRWSITLGVLAMLAPVAAYAHPKPGPAGKPSDAVHVVREGETLSLLAKRYRVTVKALAEANGLNQPNYLRVGQKIVVPAKEEPAPAKSPAEKPAARIPVPPAHFVLTPPEFDGRAPEFGWPVEGPLTSGFGRRRSGWHAGIDIKAPVGTPIFAAAAGTVYYSGWESRYGLVVKIQHAEGFVTIYAHNLQSFVEAGDEVYRGQVIGTVGRTGRASSYHLHFEIRNNGKVHHPLHFLPAREIREEPEEATQPEDDDDNEE